MNFSEEIAKKTGQIEELIKARLPKEEGYQRTVIEAADYAVLGGGKRLRPMLMTTLTTILSMVPMSLGIGEGSVMMEGMALVIIGGLIASTVLILLLMPTFYLIIDKRSRKEKRLQRKEQRRLTKEEKKKDKES